jgi:hypothetical protein
MGYGGGNGGVERSEIRLNEGTFTRGWASCDARADRQTKMGWKEARPSRCGEVGRVPWRDLSVRSYFCDATTTGLTGCGERES